MAPCSIPIFHFSHFFCFGDSLIKKSLFLIIDWGCGPAWQGRHDCRRLRQPGTFHTQSGSRKEWMPLLSSLYPFCLSWDPFPLNWTQSWSSFTNMPTSLSARWFWMLSNWLSILSIYYIKGSHSYKQAFIYEYKQSSTFSNIVFIVYIYVYMKYGSHVS